MTTTDLRMDGKVVVVTGAGQGIGRAFAEGLADAGASVVVIDIDVHKGTAVADAITAGGGDALFVAADVADDDQVRAAAAEIGERFGRVDGLVNNAAVDGAPSATPLLELSSDHYDRVMAVNVKGMWLTARAMLPLFEAAERPSVVNMGSIGAFLASAGHVPYITSKNAVIGLTKTLAKELGPRGIRVNSLAPGSTATESVSRSVPPETVESILAMQCVKERMQPEDLLGPLLFLLSDASRFVTGQTLVVDGGAVMLP